jgi:hypothetical protein
MSWFHTHAESNAEKDELSQSDRIGQVIGTAAILLILLFFVTHSSKDTGFFTEDFGQLEALLFYLPPLLSMIHNMSQAIVGRKNTVRPIEIMSNPITLVCIIGLYGSFPFDFSHLPDVLPKALRFTISWISDGLVKFLMVIGIIVLIVMSIYTPLLYIYVRQVLSGRGRGSGI